MAPKNGSGSGTIGGVNVSYTTKNGVTTYNVGGNTYNSSKDVANAIKASEGYSKGGVTNYTSNGKTYSNGVTPTGGGSGGGSSAGGGSSSSSSSASTGTDWATKFANSDIYKSLVSQYGAEATHNAFSHVASGGATDKATLQGILKGTPSKITDTNTNTNKFGSNADSIGSTLDTVYKFGKNAYNTANYDTKARNQEIAKIIGDNNINVTDVNSVQEFLEKYSPAFAESSDDDKWNTANDIYSQLSTTQSVDNESPINEETEEEIPEINMEDIFAEVDDESPINGVEEEEEETSYEDFSNEDDMRIDYEENIDSLSDVINGADEEIPEPAKTGLSDEQKQANIDASMQAWKRATDDGQTAASGNDLEGSSVEGESKTSEEVPTTTNDGALTDSASYFQFGDKMKAGLDNLLSFPNVNDQMESAKIGSALDKGQEGETIEERVESTEEGAQPEEFNNEQELVDNFTTQLDELGQEPSEENYNQALNIYQMGKDAAGHFAMRNGLSQEWYNNVVKKLQQSEGLRALVENYKNRGLKK